MKVGLLHTVPGLAPVFQELLHDRRDDLDLVDVVDASLLADTVAAGEVTPAIEARISDRLTALRDAGAESVLVTCSSIGEAAERAADATGITLVRVDAAMAEIAIARARTAGREAGRAGTIAVLATLPTTLGPTTRLVERARAGDDIVISSDVVAAAAAARSAGDDARHDELIADALRATDADVVVFAQASMASAAGDDSRVLTSPASGAEAFVRSLGVVR